VKSVSNLAFNICVHTVGWKGKSPLVFSTRGITSLCFYFHWSSVNFVWNESGRNAVLESHFCTPKIYAESAFEFLKLDRNQFVDCLRYLKGLSLILDKIVIIRTKNL
jgi:hypothetical protein